ncbi:hypothetical protein, partial [Klebsiella pneumoniae]|uniref:hypothetical protein n=1 Tax=Klebsiella pneumoniae TaxID=573 RepID=UPI001F4A3F73
LEAKRLLDNEIYTDLENAYSEADNIIKEASVEFNKTHEKKQLQSPVKSIKQRLSNNGSIINHP